MKTLADVLIAVVVAVILAVLLNCAVGATPITPSPPREEINLGECEAPRAITRRDGARFYVVRCSSGAFIVLPASLVERGEGGPLIPGEPELKV